ncbi:COG3014 family protein [Spartinivicinus poritis]|uniref:Uncharacterized protein n=1 Tax=Spartinivicinus poritis TaxID=2994640 RepID=A0ABT5U3V5_9GAMM|nr:hypothetical protein [Spartinivicinus sp. A2-2]MDE1461047.1 hypothetical protein [Spartinivicinus sp. A2-2]
MIETLLRHSLGVPCLLLCLLLQGCAFSSMRLNDLAADLEAVPPEQILAELKAIDYSDRDRVQYLLDYGVLKSLMGDFTGSIEDLQKAKQLIQQLEAISISENLSAVAVNDTLKSYVATPGEQMLLYELLAINYLMLGQVDAARVEVLQAQVKTRQFAEANEVNGRIASMEYLAGFIYELLGEIDNAMISYRNAASILESKAMPIPVLLQDNLLRCSRRLGLHTEYKRYVSHFNKTASFPNKSQGEVTIIYWDGVVTAKKQRFLTVYVPQLEHNVTIALPYYPENNKRVNSLRLSVNDENHYTATIESVEKIAREDLDAQSTVIYSTALARMVTKHLAIKASQNQNNDNLTMLLNIASVFSEAADVRSWNMLPASIQAATIQLAPGRYQLFPNQFASASQRTNASSFLDWFFANDDREVVENNGPTEHETATIKQGVRPDQFTLDIKAGQKVLLFVPRVSNRVYSTYLHN